ncbi:hypothetical protein MOBT1_002335 [Malassezia obtusa]|uniref:Bromo domain-containing protein n=1 Tax=Malassezia obtusa TaxID=76774 RepID=A0AAF0E500_9BASI|nr:hypothetical protein MOBT1_002335 [Malassezia obtusa]
MADSPEGALWEQLLLAQTVYQLAASPPAWEKVSDMLCKHPIMLEIQKNPTWTADKCETTWRALMLMHKIVEADDAKAPRTGRKAQLALAQVLYGARLAQLHEQIQEKETKFRCVWSVSPSELHERLQNLESGKLDEELCRDNGIRMEASPSPSRKRAADAPASADDSDEVNEHLQVEQDLLGSDQAADAPKTEEPEREERASTQPTNTYKSRARRRTESSGRAAEASRTPSPTRSTRRSRGRSPEVSEQSAGEEGSEAVSDAERDKTRRRTTQILLMLHNQVSNHTHGNLFHQAIKEVDAPNYYELIKQPMDLKLIKQRIKEGTIASMLDLRQALSLMFANALMYNRPDTEVHRMANEMRLATDEMLDQFEDTP